MKGIITLRSSHTALKGVLSFFWLLFFAFSPIVHAGFKDWVASKLPYKLPPEKLQFHTLRPESAIEVLDRNQNRIFYISGPKLRFYRALTEISENLQKFVVLSEDAKFFAHEGFDVDEIENSIKKNLSSNKVKRGASTITQQLAKNVFLDKKRSVTRKLFEVPWTMQIERDLTKKQILELYLNVIEWGPGIYGAEAASRHFFDKSAAEIDIKEAMYLAMIVPNPPRFDGYASAKSRDFIWTKSQTFTRRIYGEKKITEEEKDSLLTGPALLAPLDQKSRRYPLQHIAKYTGSSKEFAEKWSELSNFIRKSSKVKQNPIQTYLDKNFDVSVFEIPLSTRATDRKSPTPYLVARDEISVQAFKKLKKGSQIPEGVILSDGLSLENEFSLEEIFYVRPPQSSSIHSETVEGSGVESSSVGSETLEPSN